MSSPAEIVQSFYAAIAGRDGQALQGLVAESFADDAAVVFPEGLPYGGRVEGAAKLAKLFAGLVSSPTPIGPQNLTITDIIDDGDRIVAHVEFEGYSPTGGSIDSSALELWSFDGTKVVEMKAFYWDTAACQALATTDGQTS